MTRYKWYRLGLPRDISHLIGGIKKKIFTAESVSGFIVMQSDSGGDNFKYAWRSKIAATDIDAEGNSVIQSILTVSVCEFSIFSKFDQVWLRVADPPRSSKELLDALESVVGFGFYVETIVFSSAVHAALLRNVDDCRLVSFKGVGAVAEEKAVARIEMASKSGLNLDRFDFLRKIDYSVDHALYEVVFRREKGQVAFSISGMVKIGGSLQPYILGLVESELPKKAA